MEVSVKYYKMDKPPSYHESNHQPYAPTAPGFAPHMQAPPMAEYPPPVAPSYPPPMAPSYPPSMPTVIVVPHSGSVHYGDEPMTVMCAHCNERVITRTEFRAGALTYLSAFGLAFFVWCGCCLVPCCIDSCKDVHHFCPNCNAQVGVFKRL